MLQLNYIKENKQATIDSLKRKYFKNAEETIETVLGIDQKRRETQAELDSTLARANALAKEIGGLMKAGKKEEAEAAKAETAELKVKSKALEEELKVSESELYDVMVTIPNLPHGSVPEGRTPEENITIFEHGTIPTLHEAALPHWELIKQYDIIDFDLAKFAVNAESNAIRRFTQSNGGWSVSDSVNEDAIKFVYLKLIDSGKIILT
jgi:seryl-tRNA synthetase